MTIRLFRRTFPGVFGVLLLGGAPADDAADFRSDAMAVERGIADNYAYLDRFAGGRPPISVRLRAEAALVSDRRSLLRYAERALLALGDHHAITGSSRPDSWALVPSFADLWIEPRSGDFRIEAVRDSSPAAAAGVRAGDRLVSVDGVTTQAAVAAFWSELGMAADPSRAGFAARVLAAGRRDRSRRLTVQRGRGVPRQLDLASLYAVPRLDRPPLTVVADGADAVVRINDSLGDEATIAAFDAAMSQLAGRRVVIDLTDTPSGGNTVVARAVLGWFVTKPVGYQIHSSPREERRTGIARRWVEQVLPRAGKRHRGPVRVRVGRWTGSMGEGLAVGFAAIGARVEGEPMAGLLGAIEDVWLPRSGLVLKLPVERLYAMDGTPREAFVPRRVRRGRSAAGVSVPAKP